MKFIGFAFAPDSCGFGRGSFVHFDSTNSYPEVNGLLE